MASAPPVTPSDGTTEQPARRWIGKHMKRVEDPRYLVGRGGFVEDIELAGMLHAAVLNSPHAHARIVSIDTSAALALPGVVAVLTGEDCKAHMGPCANFGPPTLTQYPLAVDKTRHFGEAVAAVVGETIYAAEDGVAALRVEYELLEPVTDPFKALEENSPLVHEEHGNNLGYERQFEFGDVDGAFADADVVLRDTLYWGRSSGQPLETTGAVATVDHNGVTTIYCNSVTFSFCAFLIATALKVPSNKLKLQPVPAGGSFGSKFFAHKVPTLAGFLALQMGRPVRYVEDRLDHMAASDHHGSDRWYEVALAVDRDGMLRGLDVDVVDDYGAFLQFGVGTHGNALSQVAGPYKMRNIRYHLRAAITNKCQQGAYRGFGSEVQNWILERMVDKAARELKMKPEDIRRKNFLTPDQFPYKSPTGNLYDSGNYPGVLDKALSAIDLDHWRAEKARALKEEGRHIGIGIATTQERSVFSATEFWYWFDEPTFPITSSPESATVTIDPTGEMQVTLHSQAMWGNSPETMVAMVVAEEFDVDPYSINVTYADTSSGLPGTGPGGSRYTVMVAGAVRGASRTLKEKLCRIAAKDLETSVEDVEFIDGAARVKGAPQRSRSLAELAATAYFFALNLPEGDRSGLEEGYTYDHPYTTLPNADRSDLGVFYPFMGHACHIAIIEIDPVTGKLEYLDYVAVHDAGTVVNPPTLAGQVMGGTAQGIGSTLFEEYVYDERGELETNSFWEYLVPRATDIPHMRVEHFETPSPYTEYGIKGGGEGGRMVAPSALSSAIDDVLATFGDARVTRLPVKPWQIVEMMGDGA